MIRPAGRSTLRSEVLGWMDKQPNASVIYISFGSGGVLSADQITEMAWGIELRAQRFIWVVHPPSKDGDKGNDISDYLPGEFMGSWLELVTRADLLHRCLCVLAWDCLILTSGNWSWRLGELVLPATDSGFLDKSIILDPPLVGGFLSHCGWNSSLESTLNGVPMIAWPLYAEQKMIATFFVEELKVAIRPKVLPAKRIVRREEIEMMVMRKIVEEKEGDEMRARAKKEWGSSFE
ncbi:putative anthocyanidin 3-O-glucosyltransferase [Rosa chinensis]|uniref:Putative anthocyanidin 3-O-glucosyltransferase n=1 Tax=Rosa chinensis TaxID=74649 RepID=A0A2P6SI97_ROSCH|nr:putative anthocyanidin 3-O-glucosyltransferase [Rosa chinensis]